MLLTNIVLMATVGTQLKAHHVHTTFTATLLHVFLCRSAVKTNTHLAHAQNALPNSGREYSTVAKHWSKGFPYQTRRLLHSVMLKAEISNILWMSTCQMRILCSTTISYTELPSCTWEGRKLTGIGQVHGQPPMQKRNSVKHM